MSAKLAAKIAKVMGEIGRVPKRGRNLAQNYSYARADDVAEHAREALSKAGVAVYASVKDEGIREIDGKSGKIRISRVIVSWTFVDGESGEERTVFVPGEGSDYGDKGIYKAMTGSLKYALMLGFLIPTGDADPERDDDDDKRPAPKANAAERIQAMKAKVKDPVARLEAIKVATMRQFGNHAAAKSAIEKVVGRTFGDKPITNLTDAELELLEKWVTLAQAAGNAETAAAGN